MSEDFSGNRFNHVIRKIGSLRPAAWLFARSLHHVDPHVYRMSDGRFTLLSLLAGLPTIILTTTGAKTGLKRSVPLVGLPDDGKIILIASNWGQKHFPSWYHNLKANPKVEVNNNGAMGTYIAREATAEEHEAYWKLAVSLYPGVIEYKKRAGGRRIPFVVLEPLEDA